MNLKSFGIQSVILTITGSTLLRLLSEQNLILRKYDNSAKIQRTEVRSGLLQISGVTTPTP